MPIQLMAQPITVNNFLAGAYGALLGQGILAQNVQATQANPIDLESAGDSDDTPSDTDFDTETDSDADNV
jgi:hypothetical protein